MWINILRMTGPQDSHSLLDVLDALLLDVVVDNIAPAIGANFRQAAAC